MKLSKKGAAIQRAIHNALASGKALGGLLIGFAATVAGCGERHSHAHTMGRFPDSRYQENAKNEKAELAVTEGEVPVPKCQPNEINEVKEGRQTPLLGDPLPSRGRDASKK